VAFPIALGFFTDWLAFWLGCLTMGNAMGLFADSNTFWAIEHFATFIWAFDFAFRFLAFNVTDSVLWLGTGSMAFWGFANWIADCGAMRVIALP